MTQLKVTEEQFKGWVIEIAKLFKWRIHHDRPARTKHGWRTAIEGDPGFPDLVLARRGRIIFAELKSETGSLTPAQREWLKNLLGDRTVGDDDEGIEAYVWRPSDRRSIEETLR